MAIDFPNSPTNGQIFTVGDKSWIWDGTVWKAYGASLSPTVLKVDSTNSRVGINNQSPAYALDVTGVADATAFIQDATNYLSPFNGFRNAIINGDFRINQRGWSSSTATGTYGFDRWKQVNNGGIVTMSSQSFTVGSPAATGYEAEKFCRLDTSSQISSGDYAILVQQIENVRSFANSTVTVSFWAKCSSLLFGAPKVALEMQQVFGSGGSADVNTYGGQATLSTSWARYSLTVTVPSISGKTIGTSSNLGVQFWVSGGSTFNSRTGSLGIQNNTFDFWGVQVERGSYATPFEQRPIGTELALCQRYYERTYHGAGPGVLGFVDSTTQAAICGQMMVEKRVAPTFATSGSFELRRGGVVATAVSSTTGFAATTKQYRFAANTSTANLTVGQCLLFTYASGDPYLEFSSEF
jgi:hypothetical protein